jgi:hypothetical protein
MPGGGGDDDGGDIVDTNSKSYKYGRYAAYAFIALFAFAVLRRIFRR